MAKQFQFDDFDSRGNDRGKTEAPLCIACEEMLTDALDVSLSEADQAWFNGHVSTCAGCSEMLADAQRGAAWLEMLKTPRPEPSARLMGRILAQTSGLSGELQSGLEGDAVQQPQMVPAMVPAALPLGVPGNVLAFRPRAVRMAAWTNLGRRGGMFEPRLAMTAAMAFFSIALTLNLTGVQLNRLHISDLSPSNLKRTYYTANAGAARYYDNLRVVRVLESRVEDLREAAADRAQTPAEQRNAQPDERQETQPQTTPETPGSKPEENKKPAVEPGVSREATPMSKPELLRTRQEVLGTGEPVASLSRRHEAGGLV